MHLVDPALEAADLFPEGFEHGLQGLATGGGKALALVLEYAVGEVFELLFQVVPRLVQQLDLFGVTVLPLPVFGVQAGVIRLQGVVLVAHL